MAKDTAVDFATAQMPRGCSIELDKSRHTLRQGTHRVTTGGWWWGIPKRWNDPVLAYKLARFITNRENQIKECTKFGMVPVRYDVIKDPTALFLGGPISEVFKTSYRQIQTNDNFVLPSSTRIDTVTQCYLDAWKKIIMEKNWAKNPRLAPMPDHIATELKENYAPRIGK
jgi:ABC-type glycerol-3-phosphate transport system substrate-binding protein